MSHSFLSRETPTDPEALEEFSRFTPEERETFFGCRHLLIENGSEWPRTERDAVAAILEHRRLKNPYMSDREVEQALRYYEVLRQEMDEEAAEKQAVANVLAMRARRRRG